MSLLGNLAHDLPERVPGWVETAVVRGRQWVEKHPWPVGWADRLSLDLLDAMEEEREDLAAMGRVALFEAVALTGDGDLGEARRRWLASGQATLAEALAAGEADDQAAHERAAEREAAWEAFGRVAARVGEIGLRAAVPMLLAAL